MMKRKNFLFLMAFITVIIFIAVFLYFSKRSSELPPKTVKVVRGDILSSITAVGSIIPLQKTTVKSPISGSVAHFFHDEGDYVKKEAPLLEVRPQPTPEEYAARKQAVASDKAKEKKSQADVKRYAALVQRGIISQNDQAYAQAKQTYENDHLQRILDEQLLSLLETGKAKLNRQEISNLILSPTEGFIVERDINEGDPVIGQSAYQASNVLYVIADMNSLVFQGQVNEMDAAKLKLGMPAKVTLAAFPEQSFNGHITRLGLEAVKDKALFNIGFKVEIGQLNWPKTLSLRSGYSATADLITASVTGVLTLPERVLQFEAGQPYVWLAKKSGPPEKKSLKLGISDGLQVEVLEGLALGDEVLEVPPSSQN